MLLIACKSGQPEPILRCGVCERPIVSGREASVVFPAVMLEGSLHRALLVHTDPCIAIAEARLARHGEAAARMSLISYLARYMGAGTGDDVSLSRRARAGMMPSADPTPP